MSNVLQGIAALLLCVCRVLCSRGCCVWFHDSRWLRLPLLELPLSSKPSSSATPLTGQACPLTGTAQRRTTIYTPTKPVINNTLLVYREYPGDVARGCSSADTANFHSLLQELRTAITNDAQVWLTPKAVYILLSIDTPSMSHYCIYRALAVTRCS